MKKVVLIIAGVFVLVILGGGAFVGVKASTANFHHPDTQYPKIEASKDPAVIERGHYVVHNVAHCSACHADIDGKIDFNNISLDRSAPLAGGYMMEAGPFGTFYAQNLTPDPKTGIGRYTDEELARMIRQGVGHDGRLLPMMTLATGTMSDEDLTAVISYLRAQKPVEKHVPRDEFGILAKLLSDSFGPRTKASPVHVPKSDEPSVARGEYLANGPAVCGGCHSPVDPTAGFALSGPAFSGAAEPDPDYTDPDYAIIAPNLTPDATGIAGKWDEQQFVDRMHGGRVINGSKMPWENFQQMSEADVRSIYRYLKTLEPVHNDVGPTRRPM